MKTKPTKEIVRAALHGDAQLEADVIEQLNELKFGEQLTKLRKSAGLTQKELADELGVSQSFVSKLESGKNAEIVSVLRMARALGKKVVLTFEDNKESGPSTRRGRALPKRRSSPSRAARRG